VPVSSASAVCEFTDGQPQAGCPTTSTPAVATFTGAAAAQKPAAALVGGVIALMAFA